MEKTMKRNIGDIDRDIRLILGMVLLVIGVMLNSWVGLIGVVLLGTGILDWCPIYAIFRIDSCRQKPNAV
jgi:heme O synthase-like polyprenyltransferase